MQWRKTAKHCELSRRMTTGGTCGVAVLSGYKAVMSECSCFSSISAVSCSIANVILVILCHFDQSLKQMNEVLGLSFTEDSGGFFPSKRIGICSSLRRRRHRLNLRISLTSPRDHYSRSSAVMKSRCRCFAGVETNSCSCEAIGRPPIELIPDGLFAKRKTRSLDLTDVNSPRERPTVRNLATPNRFLTDLLTKE